MYEMNIRQLFDLARIGNLAGNIKNKTGYDLKDHSP